MNEQYMGNEEAKLDSIGLCAVCGANPQNPQLPSDMCLQCFHGNGHNNCEAGGCPNPSRERFDNQVYCDIHFASSVAHAYGEYLKIRSEVNDLREHVDARTQYDAIHPDSLDMTDAEVAPDAKSVYDSWTRVKLLEKEANSIKKDIKQAMNKDVQVFHPNYVVFG
jgi:hypothetical protein